MDCWLNRFDIWLVDSIVINSVLQCLYHRSIMKQYRASSHWWELWPQSTAIPERKSWPMKLLFLEREKSPVHSLYWRIIEAMWGVFLFPFMLCSEWQSSLVFCSFYMQKGLNCQHASVLLQEISFKKKKKKKN